MHVFWSDGVATCHIGGPSFILGLVWASLPGMDQAPSSPAGQELNEVSTWQFPGHFCSWPVSIRLSQTTHVFGPAQPLCGPQLWKHEPSFLSFSLKRLSPFFHAPSGTTSATCLIHCSLPFREASPSSRCLSFNTHWSIIPWTSGTVSKR